MTAFYGALTCPGEKKVVHGGDPHWTKKNQVLIKGANFMRYIYFLSALLFLVGVFGVPFSWAQNVTPTPVTSLSPVPEEAASPATQTNLLKIDLPIPAGSFGVRETFRMAFFNLGDLNSYQAYQAYHYQQIQNATFQYQTVTTTLSNCAVFEVNPFYVLNPGLEVGVAFDYWAFTPLLFDATDNNPDYFHDRQHNLNSFEIDLKARLYLNSSPKDGVRFFLEPGAGIQPIQYQLVETYINTSNSPSSDQVGDNTNATAFDASLLAGLVVSLGSQVSLSLNGGYQYDYATNFNGTWNDNGVPAKNGVAGMDRFYTFPNNGPGQILFTPNNPNDYALFNLTSAEVAASRPIVVDLSGIRLSTDLTLKF